MATIVERVLAGEIRAAARLMRDLDDGLPEARATLRDLFPSTGRAWVALPEELVQALQSAELQTDPDSFRQGALAMQRTVLYVLERLALATEPSLVAMQVATLRRAAQEVRAIDAGDLDD